MMQWKNKELRGAFLNRAFTEAGPGLFLGGENL